MLFIGVVNIIIIHDMFQTSVGTNKQQIWCWGWLAWLNNAGPQPCDMISEMNIKQLCCSEHSLLALTQEGKVYFMYFCSETPCPQLVEGTRSRYYFVPLY